MLHSLTHDGTRYLANAWYLSDLMTPALFRSTDAANWSQVEQGNEPPRLGGWAELAFGAATFVLARDDGVATSADGAAWSRAPLPTPGLLLGVRFTGGALVALGEKGAIFTSPDGASWTRRSTTATRALSAAAYGAARWVAVGLGGAILSSEDGVSFAERPSPTSADLADVAFLP